MYPQGAVISYGWGISNCIEVGILESSKINNSTLDGIYNVFNNSGKEIRINDVPIRFHYTGFFQNDIAIEEKTPENVEVGSEKLGTIGKTESQNETNKTTDNLSKYRTLSGFEVLCTFLITLTAAIYLNKSKKSD
ncbi:MAG: hypothetical protein ACPK85_02525 [Methanosarcina sp.]